MRLSGPVGFDLDMTLIDSRPAILASFAELAQETGLSARSLVRLGRLDVAHGITDQSGHYFLATGLEPGVPEREAEEQDMRQAWVSRVRFEEMISEGLITDDSTVAAYTLLLLRERGRGPGPAGRR